MTEYFVSVNGMTCDHCVKAVEKELSLVEGVENVRVSLEPQGTSAVAFEASEQPGADIVQAAIDEAGYEMVGEVHTA